jgi:hypothetical protein
MLETLIKEYQEAQAKMYKALGKLNDYEDGFIYLTCLRCYGSVRWEQHTNEFVAQQLCDEYYGDNGIVDVYTNNPNHNIQSYGDVEVKSIDGLKEMSKENTSMTQAICNWISKL